MSEALIEEFIERSTVGIIVGNEKRQIIRANRACSTMFGKSEQELATLGYPAIVDLSDSRFEDIVAARNARGIASGVFRCIRADGSLFEVDATTCLVGNGKQRLLCWLFTDATARESNLAFSQRWQRIFNGSGLSLAISRVSDDTLVEVSPTFAAERGYRPEELVGQNVSILRAPHLSSGLHAVKATLNSRGRHTWRTIQVRKDGSTFPVRMIGTVIYDHDGKPAFRIVVCMELSGQENAELMLQAAVDGTPSSMAILDQRGCIRLVNQAWREITLLGGGDGQNSGEGANYIDTCLRAARDGETPEARATARDAAEALREILAGGKTRHCFEYCCPMPGSDRWYRATFTAFNIQGQIHAVVVHQDITEKVLANQGLVRQAEALANRARELDEMNIALRVLLDQREKERQEMRKELSASIRELVLPTLEALAKDHDGSEASRERAAMLSRHFETLLSPAGPGAIPQRDELGASESRIASLIQSGLSSKEIATILNISRHTVHYYRAKIRKKLGLVGRREGLRRHLV